MRKYQGFTLIELMVAIMIFAIISIMSYRIISSLLITKQIVTANQAKWGNLAQAINRMNGAISKSIPLPVRDNNGSILSAVIGKNKLTSLYDAQLELTTSGNIGDPIYGSNPPKRIGFRFLNGVLYIISWPVLNRIVNTNPRIDVLLENISTFDVMFLYPDKQWRDTWPLDNGSAQILPAGIKINIILKSKEEITRQWALW